MSIGIVFFHMLVILGGEFTCTLVLSAGNGAARTDKILCLMEFFPCEKGLDIDALARGSIRRAGLIDTTSDMSIGCQISDMRSH